MTQLLDPEMQSLLVNGLLHEARMATASTHSSNAQVEATELQRQRPSVLFRPTLERLPVDGTFMFRVMYGTGYPDGVMGVGDTPEEAMVDFDREWVKRIV